MARKIKETQSNQVTLTHWEETQVLRKSHYEFSNIGDFASFQDSIAHFLVVVSTMPCLEFHPIPNWKKNHVIHIAQ